MDRKKFITIHGYHNEYSKKAMREVAAIYEKSDGEWATNYTFAICRFLNNRGGDYGFLFCDCEAEDGQAILGAL